jgi:predicted dehydrogenase
VATRKTKEPLRMAVVGLGHFAQVAVLPAIEQLPGVTLAALVSGDPEKLHELGDRYGVTERRGYDELDDLLAGGSIEAVYVVTPNDLHRKHALVALRRGVHVLCEKPMAATEEECREMIRAAEEGKARLMIGYRLHFEAGNLHAIELVKGGAIGQPRLFNSTFTMQVREHNIRIEPRPGAGPVYDIGIYCINAARYLLREEPVEVSAMALANPDDPRFENVDEGVAATLRFPSGALASFSISFGAASRASYEVVGTTGSVQVENAYEYTESMVVRHQPEEGKPKQRKFGKRDQIAAELQYFSKCIRAGKEPEPSGWEGLADVRIIQAVERAAHTGERVTLEPFERDRRPSEAQEIEVPPHDEPDTVNVDSASR